MAEKIWFCSDCNGALNVKHFVFPRYTPDENRETVLAAVEAMRPLKPKATGSVSEFHWGGMKCDCCGLGPHGTRYEFAVTELPKRLQKRRTPGGWDKADA